jgi:hypothetical protein
MLPRACTMELSAFDGRWWVGTEQGAVSVNLAACHTAHMLSRVALDMRMVLMVIVHCHGGISWCWLILEMLSCA